VFLSFLALLVRGLLGRCGLGRILLGFSGGRSLLLRPLLSLLLRFALRLGSGLLLLLGPFRRSLRGIAFRLGGGFLLLLGPLRCGLGGIALRLGLLRGALLLLLLRRALLRGGSHRRLARPRRLPHRGRRPWARELGRHDRMHHGRRRQANGFVEAGAGAGTRTTGVCAAARCATAGTVVFTATWVAVALAGASMVTWLIVVLLMVVLLIVVLLMVVLLIRIPTATTGGAPITTAGGVPIGAGTIRPYAEPGGGGTKTPSGPMGGGPAMTPGRTAAKAKPKPIAGATKETCGAPQKPPTNTTCEPRWS
jgi:hypothetical protein